MEGLYRNHDISAINPFQYDISAQESVQENVNLFRGAVSFCYQLVQLPERNGIGIGLRAMYQGEVCQSASTRNREAPVSVMGLGWELEEEYISWNQEENYLLPCQRQYYYGAGGARTPLYRCLVPWQRGSLAASFEEELHKNRVSQRLAQALQAQGLSVMAGALLEELGENRICLTDSGEEEILIIEKAGTEYTILDGGEAYENAAFDFARIRYYQALEVWKITDKNGITSVYGGKEEQEKADALSLSVVWSGWKGASSCTRDDDGNRIQQQIPWRYHISRKYNQWGDEVRYRYGQVRQQVGEDGLEYTKACYLEEMTDMFGHRVVLQYQDKQYAPDQEGPREYEDPYKKIPDNRADVWQSCYEGRYLQGIEIYHPDGSVMNKVVLAYEMDFPYPPEDEKARGDLAKRFLTSITLVNGHGRRQSISFTYAGNGEVNAGAINAVAYPNGTTVKYTYMEKELPVAKNTRMSLPNPYGKGAPKLWFGDDYCLVLWVDGDRMSGRFYTFSGRWQEWNPGDCFRGISPDSIRVAQGEGFLLLLAEWAAGSGSVCLVFHQNDSVACSFQEPEQVDLPGTGWTVCTGEDFYLLWNALEWRFEGKKWNRRMRCWEEQTPGLPQPELYEERLLCSNGRCVSVFRLDSGRNETALCLCALEEPTGFRTVQNVPLPEIFPDRGDIDGLSLDFKRDIIALSVITGRYQNGFYYDIYLWVISQEKGDYRLGDYQSFRAQYSHQKGKVIEKERWAAMIVDDNMVMAGGRLYAYNGKNWQENIRLAAESGWTDETETVYAYTQGCALKTEYHGNEMAGQYLTYRAKEDSICWDSAPVKQFHIVQEQEEKRGMATAWGNLVSWDLSLYNMEKFWKGDRPFQRELNKLPARTDTFSLFNRGENYAAYQLREEEESCIMVFKNGEILERRERRECFSRTQEEAGAEGKLPGNAFACYTYKRAGDDITSVSLCWLGGRGMEEYRSCYQVASAAFEGSSFRRGKRFEYDADYAISDNMAQSAGYYRTRVYPDLEPGCSYGYTDYYYHNSLALVSPKENQEQISLADGQLICTIVYNSRHEEVSRVEAAYEYSHKVFVEGKERDIAGVILKKADTRTRIDRVESREEIWYHPGNGLVMQSRRQNYNALGEPENYREATQYGFERYGGLRFRNDVAAVSGQELRYSKAQGEEQVIAASARTYCAWERKGMPWGFSQQGTYQWQGGEYQEFGAAGQSLASGWEQVSSVEKRNSQGLVLEKQEPMGEYFSSIYDSQGKNITATVSGARVSLGEAFYYGFEEYEEAPDWRLSSEKTPIIQDYSHTGNRCLCILPGAETAPLVCTVGELTAEKEFMLQCWSEKEEDCEAGLRLVFSDGTAREEKLSRSAGWQANIFFFTLAPGKAVCQIYFYNRGSSPAYVDNLSMSFPKMPVSARIYNPKGTLLTGMAGAYDECGEFLYDDWHRKVGSTSRDVDMTEWKAAGVSSLAGSAWNTLFTVKASGSSAYEKFDGMGRWKRHWAVEGDWTTALDADNGGRVICHKGKDRASLVYNAPLKLRNGYAAGFLADLDKAAQLEVTLAKGLTVLWKDGIFRLKDSGGKTEQEMRQETPGRHWIVLFGETAALAVDGVLIFSHIPAGERDGAFGIAASGKVEIGGIMLGEQPQVGMQYFDKTGHFLQGHSLNGTEFTVTAMGYDGCGRAVYHTKPVRFSGGPGKEPLRFREGFVRAVDEKGALHGEAAEAHPEDEGYPYVGQRYEDYPGGRLTETGAPGKMLSLKKKGETAHTTRYVYGCNEEAPDGLPFPAGKYYKTKTINPNGDVTLQYQDSRGQKVAEVACLADKKLITSYITEYQKDRVMKEIRFPAWYEKEREGHEEFVCRQASDYVGTVSEISEPDTGTTNFFYMEDGRMRFSQDEAQRKKGVIAYWKYDEAKQVTEEGVFPGAWDIELFRGHRRDCGVWPGKGQGAVQRIRYRYDGDRTLSEMGELTQTATKSQDGQVSIITRMEYDSKHRMCMKQIQLSGEAVPGKEVSFRQSYTYDTAQRLLSITYADGNRVFFEYDQEGKTKQVKNRQGESILSYTYNQSDQIEQVVQGTKEQGRVAYTYHPNGWPIRIEGPLLEENLTYEKSDSEGPFHGKLSRVEVKLKLPEQLRKKEGEGKIPSCVRYDISYDEAGRLTSALCVADGKEYPEWSLGAESPIQYDANGNIIKIQAGKGIEQYLYRAGTNQVCHTDKAGDVVYDENGRVTSVPRRGIIKIAYPESGCLPSRLETKDGTAEYWYDESGRRIGKAEGDLQTVYLRNAEGKVIEEIRFSKGEKEGNVQYLYGSNGFSGYFKDGDFRYAHVDHIGSLRGITKADGTVLSAYQYGPFGEPHILSGEESSCIQGFAGYEWEKAGGLYFSGGRLYDPVLRRFYGADPKRQYASPYVYCGNDPFSMVDPDGESSWWACLIGVIVGLVATIVTAGVGGFVAAAAAASDIGASVAASVAGAVAGAAGSVVGTTITAAIDTEPITASMLLGSLASGAIGGAAGGLGGIGQPVMRAAAQAGYGTIKQLTRIGLAVSAAAGVVGGAASVAETAISGGSFQDAKTWISVGIGALTGMGAALLSSNAFFGMMNIMPIATRGNVAIRDLFDAQPGVQRHYVQLHKKFGMNRFHAFVPEGQFVEMGEYMLKKNISPFKLHGNHYDALTVHGLGRRFFPVIGGEMHFMYQREFIAALTREYPDIVGGEKGPLKLMVCFSNMFGRYSNAQALADATQRQTYGTLGVTYPAGNNHWLVRNPRP